MPMPAEQLSRFFTRQRKVWEHLWNRRVDLGQMSEQTLERYLAAADDIGAILHALAEDQARLEYVSDAVRTPLPPGVPIFVPPRVPVED